MRYNLSLSGGNSKGLTYSQLVKEIDDKNIKFNRLAGTSCGAIFATMIACGLSFDKCKALFKKIPFDRIMRWENDIEKKKWTFYNFPVKIFKALSVLTFMKTIMWKRMKKLFKKNVTWDMVTKAKRVKDLFLCWIPQRDLAHLVGSSKNFTVFDLIPLLRGKGDFEKQSDKIRPYYFSNKGTFVYNPHTKELELFSKTVPPLWQCVCASFYNPVMGKLKIKLDIGGKMETFEVMDGGVVDNYSACSQINKYINVSCDGYPKSKAKELTDFYFKLNEGKQQYSLMTKTPHSKLAFFNFNDKIIDIEFSDNTEPSNIF